MDLRSIKEAKSARQGMWEVKRKSSHGGCCRVSHLGTRKGAAAEHRRRAGIWAGAGKTEAELSFRGDESEVPLGPPCEDGGLDLGYLNLESESERGREDEKGVEGGRSQG